MLNQNIAELNVDVRITPYSNLVPLSKYSPKTSSVYNRNRSESLNISNRAILLRNKTRLDQPQYLKPAKSLHSNNNNLLLITKKNTKPQFSLKITPNIVQPTNKIQTSSVADAKRVLLYQQIERNKLSSNGAELINRFNYKV